MISHSNQLGTDDLVWGFYGHKLINKLAVYLLPDPMLSYFSTHINEISDHAIDPDKRRYASKFEGIRHYMDIEHWLDEMDTIPLRWDKMLVQNTSIYGVKELDTTLMLSIDEGELMMGKMPSSIFKDSFEIFVNNQIMPNIFRGIDELKFNQLPLWLIKNFPHFKKYIWKVKLIEHGILPYNLLEYQKKLTRAFEQKNHIRIMRYAADIGHYIGDAHVPLHTTANYNGQLTNQNGIHAFWETRIPELFAESSFDLFNDKAKYIENPLEWFWSIVNDSHSLVDSVLIIEKRLSKSVPRHRQYVMAKRSQTVQRMETEEYAKLYEKTMGQMVEHQMRKAILAISCAWVTAWVDAGQPDLQHIEKLENLIEQSKSKPAIISKDIRGH